MITKALLSIAMLALLLPTSALADDGVLKGKVQRSDAPMRIQRPALPVLNETADPTADLERVTATVPKKPPLQGSAIKDSDFAPEWLKQSPITDKEDPELKAEIDNKELIIEWERWHHRFSQAVFERWRELGKIPGFAQTTITITRDRHIIVEIGEVELPPDVYEIMRYPQYRAYPLQTLKRMYADSIRYSLLPLEGSSAIEFPKQSRRKQVTLTPTFSGTLDEGYHWVHGDRERVPLN